VLQPHPYYKVSPLSGVIPGNGTDGVDIKITFTPITLGSCTTSLKLFIEQPGYVPLESIISARAVSGLIESNAFISAEEAVLRHVRSANAALNNILGSNSTFKGDDTLMQTSILKNGRSLSPQHQMGTMKRVAKDHSGDAVATMLASTFRSSDLNRALDSVLTVDNTLLGSKIITHNAGHTRDIDGVPKAVIPVKPRGPGSGSVFDAGGQWLMTHHRKKFLLKRAKMTKGDTLEMSKSSILPVVNEDKLVEGLRIPPSLDSTFALNFVLTQEPGKLTPKDLKAAIERNRAEKEMRAEEQMKLRKEGGGAGLLDLRAILAEERLNVNDGDPFKRQLREMAFLADVDDVEKQEIEKGFRVSEEYLGSNLLSNDDVKSVYMQRARSALYNKRTQWRNIQSRQHSDLYPSNHPSKKAGAPTAVSRRAAKVLTPSFDSNRNDIWAKRMNTLRRLVALASKWIIRRRMLKRLELLMNAIKEAGVKNRAEAREWITNDNANQKSKAAPSKSKDKNIAAEIPNSAGVSDVVTKTEKKPLTLTTLLFESPNEAVAKRLNVQRILDTKSFVITAEMMRRVLFPKFTVEEGAKKTELSPGSAANPISFDDRTFFQLKIRPEYITLRLAEYKPPALPLYFPPCLGLTKRNGAPEELLARSPADSKLKSQEILSTVSIDKPSLASTRSAAIASLIPKVIVDEFEDPPLQVDFNECGISSPSWLTGTTSWGANDVNFFRPRPDLRLYSPQPRTMEIESTWCIRPQGQTLAFQEDNSLRTRYAAQKTYLTIDLYAISNTSCIIVIFLTSFFIFISWLNASGFLSAHVYLLGAHESRSKDPPPSPGPTLTNMYMVNSDRHRSGMCCFARDHTRSAEELDPDLLPLQNAPDKRDILTDSESDDEDVYIHDPPSINLIRTILGRETKENADNDSPIRHSYALKDGIPQTPMSMTSGFEDPAFGGVSNSERSEDQVELLRDRKTLDLESTLARNRQKHADSIADKMAAISKLSLCALQALPLQIPFHSFEDAVTKAPQTQTMIHTPKLQLPFSQTNHLQASTQIMS